MSDTNTITSANAVLVLTVDELYPAGITLQNFSADTSASTGDLTLSETRMGVDGHLAVGYTPAPIDVTINLEANSPSREKLENIASASRLNNTAYQCDLLVSIPSIGKTYSYKNGYMKTGHVMPDLKKVLDPTTWAFTFESVEISGI